MRRTTLAILAGLVRTLPRLRSRDPTSLAWACVGTAIIVSGLYDFTWSFPPLVAIGVVALARLAPITASPTGRIAADGGNRGVVRTNTPPVGPESSTIPRSSPQDDGAAQKKASW